MPEDLIVVQKLVTFAICVALLQPLQVKCVLHTNGAH